MRRIARSASTPITESCGPVIPASVSAAVPPGCTRASFVCTCVCVPITAVTRPSSHRAIGDVFAVQDAEVRAELRAQTAQPLLDRTTTGRAEDVGDEQDFHLASLAAAGSRWAKSGFAGG